MRIEVELTEKEDRERFELAVLVMTEIVPIESIYRVYEGFV